MRAVDPKLKEVLTKKIRLAQKDLADHPGLKVKLEGKARSTSPGWDAERPKNALHELVRKKLLKERLWEAVAADLAQLALAEFIRDLERKDESAASRIELSAARARQLELFPGYETLPTRVRNGRGFTKFPDLPVPEFLAYEEKYQSRAQRDQRTAEELHRLAIAVRPYAENHPDMTVADAFDHVQATPPGLTVIPGKKAPGTQ